MVTTNHFCDPFSPDHSKQCRGAGLHRNVPRSWISVNLRLCQAQDGSIMQLETSFGTQGDFVCDQSFLRSQDGASRRLIRRRISLRGVAGARGLGTVSAYSKKDSDSSLSGQIIESLTLP